MFVKFLSLVVCISLTLISCGGPSTSNGPGDSYSGKITLSGAWALYPMVVTWAEAYQSTYPHVTIDVAAGGAGKGMADALSGAVDLGMVSRAIAPEEIERGAWWVSVVKDAVVPVINADHPLRDEILHRGLTPAEFRALWIDGEPTDWGSLLGAQPGYPVHLYTRSDACGAAQTWAYYLGYNQEDLQGVGVFGDPGLAEAVRSDVLGIGYNNINFVYDRGTKTPVRGLIVCPIDFDENGRMDWNETFYDSLDTITGAIGEGLYPSPPSRDLHLVSHQVPERPVVRAFLKWILNEGQALVKEAGYLPLSNSKLEAERARLNLAGEPGS